jgi:hypothetical protein
MSDKRIDRVTIKRIAGSIRAEAEVRSLPENAVQIVASSGLAGVSPDADTAALKEMEDAQLAELRKRLYTAGFSKRAIATAIKSVVRVDTRGD